DLDLQAEAERLTNADTLHNAATTAHEALISDPSAAAYDSADVLTLLGSARSALESAAAHDPALGTLASRVSEVTYLISDVAAELASYADSIEADPGRLAVVQDRRAELTRLIRQYGAAPVPQASGVAEGERAAATGPNSSVQVAIGGVQAQGRGVQADEAGNLPPAEEGDGARPEEARSAVPDLAAVLSWAKGAVVRLAELDGDDEKIAELETLEAELAVTVRDLGGQLSSLRQEAATTFDDAVTAELGALAMPHARLKAVVSPLREYGLHGGDDVEIKLAAHPGAPALALHKGASGG